MSSSPVADMEGLLLGTTNGTSNPNFVGMRRGDRESGPGNSHRGSMNGEMRMHPPPITSYDSSGSQNSSPTGALVWSDWPMDLPSQSVVDHMCTVFFDKIPTLPRMIHRATFFAGLSLPPSNRKFPVSTSAIG